MLAYDAVVIVQRVLSQLDRGCIFTATQDDGSAIRVRFRGSDTQPLPGDAFRVKGLLATYRDRQGHTVPQVDSNCMTREVVHGHLLAPRLARLPNIGKVRSERLVARYGGELATVLLTSRAFARWPRCWNRRSRRLRCASQPRSLPLRPATPQRES
jgi:exodeoxyribonuclease V alpha subunit